MSLPRFSLLLLLAAGVARAEPTVTASKWRELEAFTLTDGRSVAVVVPKLGGRVLEFRLTTGPNWIWSGAPGVEQKTPTLAWGGEKTYLGPQPLWRLFTGRAWPPPLEPDSQPHPAEMLPGGALRTVSPVWAGFDDARIVRTYRFTPNGDFEIEHRIDPLPGSKIVAAIWEIAQTVPPEAVYVPLNPVSPYKDSVHWFDFAKPKEHLGVKPLSPTLLEVKPATGNGWKLGAHPAQPALMSVRDGFALIGRSAVQTGDYPEGVEGAGFPVEVYHHDLSGASEYVELEFLSPLRRLDHGATLTTSWKIQPLPAVGPAEIEKLLSVP